MHRNKGFTLIEISIVLVIIGLVVGGVMVGRDLIKAAEIRSTISELEKMNAAMNTFRLKYNGLPGDLEVNKAAQFGMTTRSGAAGHGDGNMRLEGCSLASSGRNSTFGCETALVWRDLSDAQLVSGSFASATDALTAVASGAQQLYFPKSNLRNSLYYTTLSFDGLNFLFLSNIQSTNGAGQYSLSNTAGNLSPDEARLIDEKVDDANPLTGIIIAASSNLTIVGMTNLMDTPSCSGCICSPPGGGGSVVSEICISKQGARCVMYPYTYNSYPQYTESARNCQLSYRLK